MKNVINIKNLSILFLGFLIIAIQACTKDDSVANSGQVELLSYGPAGVSHGDSVKIIGKNLAQVTEIVLGGVAIPKSAFVSQNDNLIVVLVPKEAVRGKLILKTPGGDIESKAAIDFNVPVKITNMPLTVRPGQTITLQGEYLNWVTSILIPADSLITEFTRASLNQLVFTVPMTAQTGKWLFSTSGTKPIEFLSENDINVTLPSITSITPNPVMPETNITINGNDLDLVKEIKINGVAQSITTFITKTASQIVLKVPKEALAGKITLVAYSGVNVISANDLAIVLPVITSIAPMAIDRGQNLTINGNNFDLIKSVSLKGSNPVTSYVSKTNTQIVVTMPADVVSGKVAVITNSGVIIESAEVLKINGDLPALAPLKYVMYDDAMQNGWQLWGGWGGATTDISSTEKIRQGEKAMKVTFAGSWGAGAQLGGSSAPTTGSTELALAIYGGPGTNGKKITLIAKGGSNQNTEIVITEGEWTEYKIPLSTFGSPANITEFALQEQGWSGTIYVDNIGLR